MSAAEKYRRALARHFGKVEEVWGAYRAARERQLRAVAGAEGRLRRELGLERPEGGADYGAGGEVLIVAAVKRGGRGFKLRRRP